MPQTEWPVAFFDDDYLRMYRPLFTPERTAAEVERVYAEVVGLPVPAGAGATG